MKQIDYDEAVSQLISLGDWIRWAASRFEEAELYYGHGTDNAWDEAVALVMQTLSLSYDLNPQVFGSRLTSAERRDIAQNIKDRIEKHIPVPYLTKQAWFMGLPFYVDERVLIPRSPFAEWIENHFEPWVASENVHRILEIGTGSGCMAIACAQSFPEAHIDAVDISEDALDVARRNVEKHGLQEQVKLVQSDCFAALGESTYDIIISNPPYVGDAEMAGLPQEYLVEPDSALRASEDGLAIVMAILKDAQRHLNANGVLIVEVGNSDEALAARLPDMPFTWLEQSNGGHGLFVLTKEQLIK
jgi:ribosomal protein L3 glutamine methyltransferase